MKRKLLTGLAVVGLTAILAAGAYAHGSFGGPQTGTGPWHGGQGMMGGPGMMHGGQQGMMGGYGGTPCAGTAGGEPLTPEKAKAFVEQRLAMHGSTLLKVGQVTETKDGKIVVDVVTTDGGKTAHKIEFDAKTGAHTPVK